MASPTPTVAASSAQTANGNSGPVVLPNSAENIALIIDVSAVSGTTPSAAFTVEWSNDGAIWAKGDAADSFTAITAAGTVVKQFSAKGRMFRLVWALTGTTPSFTFSATGSHTGPRSPA